MIEISKLSSRYDVRMMDDSDVEKILKLCMDNTQFYEYCQARPTREQILDDLHTAPLGKDASSKYYIGFFEKDELVAVMDLIDGYPETDICFIGFFMMDMEHQGKGTGSFIIDEVCEYLKEKGYAAVQLGIDKGNPQSNHFWKKNGFTNIKEIDRGGWTVVYSEKILR